MPVSHLLQKIVSFTITVVLKFTLSPHEKGIEMLERHEEAPDSFETPNVYLETNWERLRDAPLVGLNGIIDWNQIERERVLGIEPEYTWTEDDDDTQNECFSDDEDSCYDNFDERVCEYLLEEEVDIIEWIPNEAEADEYIEMMAVDW